MTEPTTESSSRPLILVGLGVAAIAVAGYFLLKGNKTPEEPVITVVSGQIESAPEPVEVLDVTPREQEQVVEDVITEPSPAPIIVPQPVALNESDAPFSFALAQLGPAHPISAWLTPNQLIRKTTAMVDGLSRGELVFKNRPIQSTAIDGQFKVDTNSGEMVLSATNFSRYDRIISALEYIDIEMATDLYRFWSPRLEEAYAELGVPGSFDRALDDALTQFIDAPVVEGRVVLVRPAVYYKFQDSQLERMNDIQKLMIRVGPANAERIQKKLRELRDALRNQ